MVFDDHAMQCMVGIVAHCGSVWLTVALHGSTTLLTIKLLELDSIQVNQVFADNFILRNIRRESILIEFFN